jgi:hypothetical protein
MLMLQLSVHAWLLASDIIFYDQSLLKEALMDHLISLFEAIVLSLVMLVALILPITYLCSRRSSKAVLTTSHTISGVRSFIRISQVRCRKNARRAIKLVLPCLEIYICSKGCC